LPIYEYKCPKGHITEKLVPLEQREGSQFCNYPGCGQLAKFIVSAAHLDYLGMGKDSSFPTASDKWADMHKQGAKQSND
jgi:hypothetical protein